MTPFAEVWRAGRGWVELLSGRPAGVECFNRTRAGVASALIVYALMIALTLAIQGIRSGVLTTLQALFSVAANALPLAGVAVVIVASIGALRLSATFADLFVPATYAMAFVLAAGLPVSLFLPEFYSNFLLLLLAFMFYREARIAGKMSVGLSVAFAALSIVVLVGLPFGLYMLTVTAAPPA